MADRIDLFWSFRSPYSSIALRRGKDAYQAILAVLDAETVMLPG